MGRYSYSQPSSSSADVDITALLEEEAQLYRDEAQSSFDIEKAVQEEMRVFQTQLRPVQEEMRVFQMQLRRVQEEGTEREQEMLLLEKSVHELGKDLTRVKLIVCLVVAIGLLLLVLRGVASKASKGSILSPRI